MDEYKESLEKELYSHIPDTKGRELVIWGTGNTAQLYQEGIERLGTEGFYVTAYCDNNSNKWGQEFCGKPVICPDELRKKKNACVLICTPTPQHIQSIKAQLETLEVTYYLLDEVILKQHTAEILTCYDMLEDLESKRIYTDIILSHIQGKYPMPENRAYDNAYFAIERFKQMDRSEIFVDCGAYVGDTLEKYIWNRDGIFKKIIAFEPDADNYVAMNRRVHRLREEWNIKEDAIVLFPYGVADQSTTSVFEAYDNGLGSKFVKITEAAGDSVQIVSLDEEVADAYSFLKADIESYEYKMLLGAEKGIKKNKPLLAICIYHNAVDLYTIPLLIKSMVGDYRMAVRHHSNTLADTVLYCWIPEES